MEYDLRNYIKAIFEMRDKIDTIEKTLAEKRASFERTLTPLKEESAKLSESLESLCDNTIPIRLGDLLEELANLTDINVSSIGIDTESGIILRGKHSIEEIIKTDEVKPKVLSDIWELDLYSNKDGKSYNRLEQTFRYTMGLKNNITDIQADGKMFLEHCTARSVNDSHTYLEITGDVSDLILNIPLGDLIGKSSSRWYPADVMTQAVFNCVERNKKKGASKKRSKKLTNK